MITPAAYSVEAYNLSHASENKIHDDSVAKQHGFTGGLVPGVEVFAYMTHPVVALWGRDWLERGSMQGGFQRPLYDGRTALVTAAAVGDGRLSLKLESDGVLCATGKATLKAAAKAPEAADYAVRMPPASAARPHADEASLAEGTWLSTKAVTLTQTLHSDYARDVRERHAIYTDEGIAHPGFLLRLCNRVLIENVVLSPWIHTASSLQNFAVAHVGDELMARGRVLRNYEHKGHRLVDIDIAVIANQRTVVAQVLHSAIYRLRKLQNP